MSLETRRKRLAIVVTHPIQYYSPVFRILSERGVLDVCVFFTWEKEATRFDREFGRTFEWDIPLEEGYEHVFIPNGGSLRRDFMGVRNPGMEERIESWGADALLVYSWNYLSHLRAMRRFHGRIPVFFWGDSNLVDPMPAWRKSLRNLFLRWVYRHVDRAFHVGSRSREYFKSVGFSDSELCFAPHSVDNDRFASASRAARGRAAEWRSSLGIGDDDVVFLFAGKFIGKKDPLLLMDAFGETACDKAHLVMVGDGELRGEMETRRRGDARIHILPFMNQSEMPIAYALCDVFCLPSRGPGETWGLAVNEAMACGKAVIVSDRVGCATDLVTDGENGYLFASGDRSDLVGKMRRMSDREAARRMGDVSRIRIASWNFTEIAVAFEQAVGGAPRLGHPDRPGKAEHSAFRHSEA